MVILSPMHVSLKNPQVQYVNVKPKHACIEKISERAADWANGGY